MTRHVWLSLSVMLCLLFGTAASDCASADTPVEQSLSAAAEAGQYAVIVFYKDQGPATKNMMANVQQGAQQRGATAVFVNASLPSERPVVERFGLTRSPMPVAVAVAPNGAVTGIFAKTISQQRLAGAFVSPGVANCMKSMQAGKLVFVWARTGQTQILPAGVDDFQRDAEFAGRAVVVSLNLSDPSEADFFKELEINPASRQDVVSLLAPPGVLVGTFGVSASKDDIAAALHKAGKCCDDPNCKHNR